MLVLTRKTGEQIIIGNDITLTVVSVGPGRVKIGIEAPDWVTVDRGEVHAKKLAEQVVAPMQVLEVELTEQASLHNRIADKLPPEPTPTAVPPLTQTPAPKSMKSLRRPTPGNMPPLKPR